MAGKKRTPLTEELILAWADDHHAQTGDWPHSTSGTVLLSPKDTWHAVDLAMAQGHGGLPGGDSLAKLLSRERGVRNKQGLPRLDQGEILEWAKTHHQATGTWPRASSGPIAGAPGETWHHVDAALRQGSRGLPGGDSLKQLLARRLRVRATTYRAIQSVEQILAWAEAHKKLTGRWPSSESASTALPPGESWAAINAQLRIGLRGLPGGSSLAKLLRQGRGQAPGRQPTRQDEQRIAE